MGKWSIRRSDISEALVYGSMKYDDVYRTHRDYFGAKPVQLLVDHGHLIDKSKPLLDVGAGQGRNAVYLARQRFTVDAIDPSKVGIDELASIADRENLAINTHCIRFEDFNTPDAGYSAVLLFGIIQDRDWESMGRLVEKVLAWLTNCGLVFVTAFTTEDPSFERFVAGEKIGKNSFVNARGVTRTFLEQGEIIELFDGFEALYHWEGIGPLHQHGENPPERHATAQAVLRKKS